jgi:hypothetical protein
MTYQELLEIIANPENSKVEFKLDSDATGNVLLKKL